jgi:hypothetical protein
MKQFLVLALLFAGLSLNAQNVDNMPLINASPANPLKLSPVIPVMAPTNAPVSGNLVLNPDGTVTVNPSDILSFLPAKYKSLILLLIALTPVWTKIITALKAGGTTTQALSSAFADKHVQVANEISQLKVRTGLPLTPAAPIVAPTPPPVAPIVPLTSLPPKP